MSPAEKAKSFRHTVPEVRLQTAPCSLCGLTDCILFPLPCAQGPGHGGLLHASQTDDDGNLLSSGMRSLLQ